MYCTHTPLLPTKIFLSLKHGFNLVEDANPGGQKKGKHKKLFLKKQ